MSRGASRASRSSMRLDSALHEADGPGHLGGVLQVGMVQFLLPSDDHDEEQQAAQSREQSREQSSADMTPRRPSSSGLDVLALVAASTDGADVSSVDSAGSAERGESESAGIGSVHVRVEHRLEERRSRSILRNSSRVSSSHGPRSRVAAAAESSSRGGSRGADGGH